MHKRMMAVAVCVVNIAISAAAQTVTGSGTSGTLPVFTGTSTIGNSGIAQSGSNVGIGTTSPARLLDIEGPVTNGTFTPVLRLGVSSPTYQGSGGGLEFSAQNNDLSETPVAAAGAYLTNGANDTQAGDFVIQTSYNNILTEKMRVKSGGNVGIGTTSPGAMLEVDGSVKLTAGSNATLTFQDGTVQSTAFTGVLCGGDYAESVDVAGNRTSYEPGDVLVISAENGSDVARSSEPYSTLAVGVYSTKPGVLGRRQSTDAKAATPEVPMAMVGIVPTKVSAENGPIKRGDLLVTSSTAGYAMKGTDRERMLGAVIGKALGNLDSGTGVVEVVITLQ